MASELSDYMRSLYPDKLNGDRPYTDDEYHNSVKDALNDDTKKIKMFNSIAERDPTAPRDPAVMEQKLRKSLVKSVQTLTPAEYQAKAEGGAINAVGKSLNEAREDEATSLATHDTATAEHIDRDSRKYPTPISLHQPSVEENEADPSTNKAVPRFPSKRWEDLMPDLKKEDPTFNEQTGQGKKYSVEMSGTWYAPGQPVVLDKESKDLVAAVEPGDYPAGAVKGYNWLDAMGSANPLEQHAVSALRTVLPDPLEGQAPVTTDLYGAGVGIPRYAQALGRKIANDPEAYKYIPEAYAKGGTMLARMASRHEQGKLLADVDTLDKMHEAGVPPNQMQQQYAHYKRAHQETPEWLDEAALTSDKVNADRWYAQKRKELLDQTRDEQTSERGQQNFQEYLTQAYQDPELSKAVNEEAGSELGRTAGQYAQMANPLNPLSMAARGAKWLGTTKPGMAVNAAGQRGAQSLAKALVPRDPTKGGLADVLSADANLYAMTPQEAKIGEATGAMTRNKLGADVTEAAHPLEQQTQDILAKYGVPDKAVPDVMREFDTALTNVAARKAASPVVADLLEAYQPAMAKVQRQAADAKLLPDLPRDVANAGKELENLRSQYPNAAEYLKASQGPQRKYNELFDRLQEADATETNLPGLNPLQNLHGQKFLEGGGGFESWWKSDIKKRAAGNPELEAQLMGDFERINQKGRKVNPAELEGLPGFKTMSKEDLALQRPHEAKAMADSPEYQHMFSRYLTEEQNLSPREAASVMDKASTMRPAERIARAMEHVGDKTGYVNKEVADYWAKNIPELQDAKTGAYTRFEPTPRSEFMNRFGEQVSEHGGQVDPDVIRNLRQNDLVVLNTKGKSLGLPADLTVPLPENMEALHGLKVPPHVARKLYRDANKVQSGQSLMKVANAVDKTFGTSLLKGAITAGNPSFELANAVGDGILVAYDLNDPIRTMPKARDIWNKVSNTPLGETGAIIPELGIPAGQLRKDMMVFGDLGKSALREAEANSVAKGTQVPTMMASKLPGGKQSMAYRLAEGGESVANQTFAALSKPGKWVNEKGVAKLMFPKANPAYSASDGVKAVHMIGQMLEGATIHDAAIGSGITLLTYGNKPKLIQAGEKMAIPFMYYGLGIQRAVMRTALKHPERFRFIKQAHDALQNAENQMNDGAIDPRLMPAEARFGNEVSAKIGGHMYRGTLDTPLSQIAPTMTALSGDSSRGVAGMLGPWITGPYSLLMGETPGVGRPTVTGTRMMAKRLRSNTGTATPFQMADEIDAMTRERPELTPMYGKNPRSEGLWNSVGSMLPIPPMLRNAGEYAASFDNSANSLATEKSKNRLWRSLLKGTTGIKVNPMDTSGEAARMAKDRDIESRYDELKYKLNSGR